MKKKIAFWIWQVVVHALAVIGAIVAFVYFTYPE